MSAARDPAAPFAPLDAPKPVAEGVWIVDSGPIRPFGLLSLPVRMTVIRLASGGLWLHSPTRLTGPLAEAVAALGPVRHVVAPNIAHWSFAGDWRRRFPEATLWAAPKLAERRPVRKSGLRIDRVLGASPPPDWAGEIDQALIAGAGGYREVLFLHRPTRTLVLTDLVANLDPATLPLFARLFSRAAGMFAAEGRAPVYLRRSVLGRRRQARAAVESMLREAPARAIFAHGRWFERDAGPRLRRALGWLLD